MNKQQQRSLETQERILNAAEASFARLGYDGTSVATICQAAGVSKGAFYHHFASKQDVFVRLLNRWLAGMDAAMSLMSERSTDVPGRVMAMSSILGQVLQVADQKLLIYLEFVNKAVRDPEIWREVVEPFHRYRAAFSDLIAEGTDEGSLRSINPEAGASIIIGLAIGLLIQGFLDPERADWTSVTQEGFSIMLEGLKR